MSERVSLKELRLIWFFPLLVIVLLVVMTLYTCLSKFLAETEQNALDFAAWQELKSALGKNGFSHSKLKMYSPSGEFLSMELTETEVSQFQEMFEQASFYRSNWRHEGSTPTEWWEVEIGNKELVLWFWGRGVFEIQSAGRTFLILSEELGYWTEESVRQAQGTS